MRKTSLLLSICLLGNVSLFADMTLKQTVDLTMKNNQDIISKGYNNSAFRKYVDEQEEQYYPKLDLSGKLEKKKTRYKYDNAETVRETGKGYNANLQLEQLIYDGKVFPKMDRAEHTDKANMYKNENDKEIVLLNSIDSFLNIMKFQKRIVKTDDFLSVLNENYGIAQKTEYINKEVLDKVQTQAKIHTTKNRLLSEKNNENKAKSFFYKNVKVEAEGIFHEPNISGLTLAPLDELIKKAAKENYLVLAQVERIKEKRAAIEEEEGEFLPTLKFKLQGTLDDDLLEDEAKTRIGSARLELNYNLFNGFINKTRTQREKLFLKEAQSELDVVTNEVINELKNSYFTYNTSKAQIEELKNLIVQDQEIVRIYKDQFNSGVRSFIDLLNVENDLYNARIDLINAQVEMYRSFFSVLKATSSLKTTIYDSNREI